MHKWIETGFDSFIAKLKEHHTGGVLISTRKYVLTYDASVGGKNTLKVDYPWNFYSVKGCKGRAVIFFVDDGLSLQILDHEALLSAMTA